MRMNLPVTEIGYPVAEGSVLVSKTDLKGVITYCNRTFCEVSGFSEGELVGAPHNLIRHPDVPAAVFADCWKTIQAGNPWNGVLKNRRKNGDYYWVEANVTPLIEGGKTVGYLSLRYQATDAQISAAERSYQTAREGGRSSRTASSPRIRATSCCNSGWRRRSSRWRSTTIAARKSCVSAATS